jgi:hypothetical protein
LGLHSIWWSSDRQSERSQARLLSDTLKRELTQKPEDVLAIVLKLIEDAKNGEHAAHTLLFERVDGKVPQAIVGDDDEAAISRFVIIGG